MIFVALLLFIIWKFFRDKTTKNISKLSYFLGAIIIVINVFWVHYLSGSYFEGSDATAYYLQASNVKQSFDLLNFIDIRYIGFNVYQIIAAYPLFENEQFASILIKLTSWSLFFLSFLNLSKNLASKGINNLQNSRFTFYSIVLMGFWLSLYNFRDIIILTCLIFISSIYIGNQKNRILKIIFILFILFYFRFFYVILLMTSFFIVQILKYIWQTNIFKLRRYNLLIISIVITVIGAFSISSIDFVNAILVQSEDTLNSKMQFNIKVESPFVSVIKGFFAGNTLDFWLNYFFRNFSRAFTITPISALVQGLIFLFSYVYFIQLFLVVVKSKQITKWIITDTNNTAIIESKKLLSLIHVIILFSFLAIITYSINMEGVQERIRVSLLILLSIVISIVYERGKIRKLLNQVQLIAIIFVFIVFVFMLR